MNILDKEMKIGKFKHFNVEFTTIPKSLKEELLRVLKGTVTDDEIIKVDCQIIFDVVVEVPKCPNSY